jgi:putative transposase
MDLAIALASTVGVVPLCRALSIPRASLYRHMRPDMTTAEALSPAEPRRASPRTLRSDERMAILDVLHSPHFQDRSPTEVYATLLDDGTYRNPSTLILRRSRPHPRPLSTRGEAPKGYPTPQRTG